MILSKNKNFLVSKFELSKHCGISPSTLRNYAKKILSKEEYEKYKNKKLLSPIYVEKFLIKLNQ